MCGSSFRFLPDWHCPKGKAVRFTFTIWKPGSICGHGDPPTMGSTA